MNAFLLAALLTVSAEWKNVQPFEVREPGLVKISLPATTLDAARPGLEDLRLVDAQGREIPFAFERPVASKGTIHPAQRVTTQLAGTRTEVVVESTVTEPVEALSLETPAASFIKAVSVTGSLDGERWQTLVTGQPIFRQNGATQLTLHFTPGNWRALRLSIDDQRSEAIAITGARLHATTGPRAPTEPVAVRLVEQADSDMQTRLTLDLGAAHLTLATLQLESTDPLFTRPVTLAVRQVTENAVTEQSLAQGSIYRFAGAERTQLELDQSVPHRELVVLVENGDSPPLTITGVKATRRPVYLIFLATQAGPYRLYTGNPRCPAPRYDVAALAGKLTGTPVAAIQIPPPAGNPTFAPTEPLPEIQDLGVALDVTEWSYRKPVELARAGVQQVELDLDVLAHGEPDMRDVRLLRAGKQQPYLVERTGTQRKLEPVVTSSSDSKRPTWSRWMLKLPRERLPVTRLTATTPTPLFRRQVRLSERPRDGRGESYDRHLGSATWERTGGTGTLRLTMDAPPVTDTLVLETDNGDNPPIELRSVTVWYAATRLLFKAPVEPGTVLYYGNPQSRAPQYDLALIATRLLAEEKSPATLGAEAALRKSAAGELFALSGTKSVLFWGALAVAVIVLLVVIAKLLPKPPPPTL